MLRQVLRRRLLKMPRLARAAFASTAAAALLLLLAALPSSPPESQLAKTALRRDHLLRRLDEDEVGSGEVGSGFDDDEQGDAGSGTKTVDNQCTRTLDAYKLQYTDDEYNCIYLQTPSITLDRYGAAGTDCPTPLDYSGFENVATVRRRLLPRPHHPPPTHLLRPRAVRRIFCGL